MSDPTASPRPTTRLAPSPTGALHLGNARTFVLNALLAITRGWRILLRIEDLDGPRVKAGAAESLSEELAWLGLSWTPPVLVQSRRSDVYQAALTELASKGLAYPCVCSRKDTQRAGAAPHVDEAADVYPGACRGRFASAEQAHQASGRPAAWRLRVTDEPITVEDRFAGRRQFHLARTCGDFVICKNDGQAAYQLAVVVDDAAGGVDCVVRGDDLLESAARQIHLRRLLGIAPEPAYWHLPLVVGPDGRRLAKRHGDTRLSFYRRHGATQEAVLGLIGYWSGLLDRRCEISLDELAQRFDLARVPTEPVVFSREDHEFLMSFGRRS
jgi:glutamyl-tRNA synthetase